MFKSNQQVLILKAIFGLVGICLGIYYLIEAFNWAFNIGFEVPLIISPFTFLVFVAQLWPRIGGLLMMIEALMSFIYFLTNWPIRLAYCSFIYVMPILFFGVCFLLLGHYSNKTLASPLRDENG